MSTRHVSLQEYPPIDLGQFLVADSQGKTRIAQELKSRLDQFGFMVFANHGISLALLDECYELSRQLFKLDIDTKEKYRAPGPGLNGYFRYLYETAVSSKLPDLKEFWHVLRQAKAEDGSDYYPINPWPDELPIFQKKISELYAQMDRTSENIMELISEVLKVSDYFPAICKDGCSTLRIVHYPAVENAGENQIRAGTHTGIQFIGIQPKTTHPGLEFLTPAQEWVRLSPEFDEHISVNVGDMLQAVSNSQLLATPHRVVNPQGSEINESRYCIVYFYHAHPESMIRPIEHLVPRPGHSPFREVRAGQWLGERIKQISRHSVAEAN